MGVIAFDAIPRGSTPQWPMGYNSPMSNQTPARKPYLINNPAIICETVAAVGLAAVWFVFGRSLIILRSLVAVVITLGSAQLLQPFMAPEYGPINQGFWAALVFHGGEFVAVCGLLAAPRGCGFELARTGQDARITRHADRRSAQFSLASLFKLFAYVAVVLGLLRLASSSEPRLSGEAYFGAVTGCLVTLTIALVFLRGFDVWRVVIATLVAGAVLVVCEIMASVVGVPLWKALVFPLGTVGLLAGSVVVFRVCGYRLERMPKAFDALASPHATPVESRL
jgi:hypothetical protein